MAATATTTATNSVSEAATLSSGSADWAGGLDVSLLTDFYKRVLTQALDQIAGPKTLVIDPTLAPAVGLVADVNGLKAHGVDRMFYLEPGALSQAQRNVVWLTNPKISNMHILADQIKHLDSARCTFTILMSPRVTTLCTQALKDDGVFGTVDIQAFPLELVPLEKDVLSLEYPDSYAAMYQQGDLNPIFDMAKAIMTLQRAFGAIPRMIGKGDASARMIGLLQRLRKELPENQKTSHAGLSGGHIDSLVVIDRQVDMVTPLCSQLTYEGLVDELIGLQAAHVEVDPNTVNPPPNALPSPSATLTFAAPTKRKRVQLQSASDPLFAELRDKNFAVVGGVLNRVARRINADYESRHAAMQGTVSQMRNFVGRLQGLQSEHQALRLHTALTEQIMQTTMGEEFNKALEIQQNIIAGLDLARQEQGIRDLIVQEASFSTVVRLLCLLSIVQGGLKKTTLEELEKEILQTYGYQHLSLFVQLNKLGLLTPRTSSSSSSAFATCRKPLRLIVDDVNEQAPDDIAYVYSGYAPMTVRMLQGALARNGGFLGWHSIQETLKALPGKMTDATQEVLEEEHANAHSSSQKDDKVTLLCFLGGCTFTEISAVRWMNQQGRGGRKIMILTTGIVNGSGVLKSLQPRSVTETKKDNDSYF